MAECIFCGGNADLAFSAKDYRRPADKTVYDLTWCKICAFGRLAGRFTSEAVKQFYEVQYYTHGGQQTKAPRRSLLDRIVSHLAWRLDYGSHIFPSEVGPGKDKSFCDLGCGRGDNLEIFWQAGFDVVGVEPDPAARNEAQKVCDVHDGLAEQLPPQIADRRFDVVLLSHVLEHCIDPKAAVLNVSRILNPSGKVIIEVPNNAAKGFSTFRESWPWLDIPRHLNFFTEKSLGRLLVDVGFSINQTRYVGYYRQFTPEWFGVQRQIWNEIGAGPKPPHFRLRSYRLLMQTAFAKDSEKYDSVRIIATKRA